MHNSMASRTKKVEIANGCIAATFFERTSMMDI